MDISFTAEMARRVAEQVRAIDPDDDDLLADMIEGETDFPALLGRLAEADAEADLPDDLRAGIVSLDTRPSGRCAIEGWAVPA